MSKFQGFAAVTQNGAPVWVMNEAKAADTGEKALKVRFGRLAWVQKHSSSGYATGVTKKVVYDGAVAWIRASAL